MNTPKMIIITMTKDTKKEIARQIKEGKRPPYWDTVGHPDHETWAHVLALHPEAGVAVMI